MFALIVSLLVAVVAAQDEDPARVPHEDYQLANGLRVVLAPDRSLPQVEVMIFYGVGSKDEAPGRSGFAHLFEHLMFMGTERVPGGGYDQILEAGGARNNGTTSHDRTSYFSYGPAAMLRTMLWLEADRMESIGGSVTQDKLDSARRVVLEERRERGANRPYGVADRAIHDIMYAPGHPYHGAVIGRAEDLEAATLIDVRAFFERYYRPNNALLAVAGDFDTEVARAWIEDLFGDLEVGPENPRPEPEGGLLGRTLRLVVHDDVQLPRLSRCYHSPAYFMPGDAELDVAAHILANERTGRLYRRLVIEEGVAVDVDAWQASRMLSSVFQIDVYVRADADLARVEALLEEELEAFKAEGPTAEEVELAVAAIEIDLMLRLESLHGRAGTLLNYWLKVRRTDAFDQDVGRFRSLTPKLVGHFCRRLLMPDRRLEVTVLPESARLDATARDARPEPSPSEPFRPPQPTITRRDSGLSVWSLPRLGLPVVSLRLVLPGGRRTEPEGAAGLATVTAAYMLEGAGERDGPEFQHALEVLGTRIVASVDAGDVTFEMTVLKRHLDPALDLLHDVLVRPRLDRDVLSDIVALKIEEARAERDDPETVARQVAFLSWFGAGHPYGEAPGGTAESLAALRMDQVFAYHASLVRPEGAVLMVTGDLDAEEIEALADRLDVDWLSGPDLPARPTPAPEATASRLILVDRPGAPQTVVRVLAPTKAGHGPTWLGSELLGTILGGSFSGRLNQNLREDKGYTYWAASAIARWPGQALWIIGTSVRADVTGAAVTEVLSELQRLSDGDVTEDEAASARAILSGDLLSAHTTMASMLNGWLSLWQTGALPSVYELYTDALPGTTAAQLNELAGDVLATEPVLIVLVGDAASIVPQLEGRGLPTPEWRDAAGRPVTAPPVIVTPLIETPVIETPVIETPVKETPVKATPVKATEDEP